MPTENYEQIKSIALCDVATLRVKGETYGSSWSLRGGVGAFMMAARKWDRIENQCKAKGYDIFEACHDSAEDGILDDIADLRAYLLLIESKVREDYGERYHHSKP